MRKYELTVVLPGKATPAKKKSTQEKIGKLIITQKGKMGKNDDWGELEFTHTIAKNNTGTYLFFELELDPGTARQIDQKLNLEEDIIRYLLVRVNG